MHAVGIDGQDCQACRFFRHPLQGPEIRPDYCGHRSSDDRREGGGHLISGFLQLLDQFFIPAQNGVHIPQAGAEYSALFPEPPGLVKTADVAGAAASVADDYNAAHLVQDRYRPGLIRREGGQMPAQTFTGGRFQQGGTLFLWYCRSGTQNNGGFKGISGSFLRCPVQGVKQSSDTIVAKGLDILVPLDAGTFRMIIAGILANRHGDGRSFCLIMQHGRIQVGQDLRIRTQGRQMPYVYIIFRGRRSEDLRDLKTVADQSQGQFERISVKGLSNRENCIRIRRAEALHGFLRRFVSAAVIQVCSQDIGQGFILFVDLIHLVEAGQLNGGDIQPLLQIRGGRSGLRVQDQVEVGLRHIHKGVEILTGRNLADLPQARLFQQIEQLRSAVQRGEIAQQIDGSGILPLFLQDGIQGLTDMDHRRPSSFPGQGIHVAGPDPYAGLFFRFAAYPFHIRAQQGVYTGNADHDDRRLFGQALYQRIHCGGNPFQVSSRDQVGLIHDQIKEAVLIARHGADSGCIASAAAGGDDQHDRIRQGQAGPFDAEAFRTGRIKGQSGRRTVDQMGVGDQLRRYIFFAPSPEVCRCTGIGLSLRGFCAKAGFIHRSSCNSFSYMYIGDE